MINIGKNTNIGVFAALLISASVIINIFALLSFQLTGLAIMWAIVELFSFSAKNKSYFIIVKVLVLVFSASITFMYINIIMTEQLMEYEVHDDKLELLNSQIKYQELQASNAQAGNDTYIALSSELAALKSVTAKYYSKPLERIYDATRECTFEGMSGSKKQKSYVKRKYMQKCNAILSKQEALDSISALDHGAIVSRLDALKGQANAFKGASPSFVRTVAESSKVAHDNISFIIITISSLLSFLFSFTVFAAGSVTVKENKLSEKNIIALSLADITINDSVKTIKEKAHCNFYTARLIYNILNK